MGLLSALFVAILFAGGLYLLMRKNLFEVLLGVMLLSNGVNLFMLSMGGWEREQLPPILDAESRNPAIAYADPLVQAFILTAIVISFGVTAVIVVLVARSWEESQAMDAAEHGREEGEA